MLQMAMQQILKCLRCGHRWLPRGKRRIKDGLIEVRVCPKCKSPYWDIKRQQSNNGGK